MEDYVAAHQDRSRNALNKSTEAAFLSWQEDVRADQAQYMSDRILNLVFGFGDWCFVFFLIQNPTKNYNLFTNSYVFVKFLWKPMPRAEKEGEKTRAKLVRQLED